MRKKPQDTDITQRSRYPQALIEGRYSPHGFWQSVTISPVLGLSRHFLNMHVGLLLSAGESQRGWSDDPAEMHIVRSFN